MKRFFTAAALVLAVLLCFSACAGDNGNAETDTQTALESETDGVANPIFDTFECQKHHIDYHYLPYTLVFHIGLDKCNEWAEEVLKGKGDTTDEATCPCPEFNIKAFLEHFEISREDFVKHSDIVSVGTFEPDVLYSKSADELEVYFSDSDALLDKTVRSQHFMFIGQYFYYNRTSELFSMMIYDEEIGYGTYPAVAQMVQKMNVSRDEFESILEWCTDKNIEVYGKSLSYEYDLDLIYNEDGSFKELPTFEGLNERLTAAKLDRIFAGIDE